MENEPTLSETPNSSILPKPRESNLPFALTLAALLVYFGFQTLQLVAQRNDLRAAKNSQEAGIQASQKVEEQFKAIMTKTSELAKQGHAGAKMVLEGLQSHGAGEQKAP